jgi:hypothetical protein
MTGFFNNVLHQRPIVEAQLTTDDDLNRQRYIVKDQTQT